MSEVYQTIIESINSLGEMYHSNSFVFILNHEYLDDVMVAINSGQQNFSEPSNAKITITYPKSGTGAIVSYVEFTIDQVFTSF